MLALLTPAASGLGGVRYRWRKPAAGIALSTIALATCFLVGRRLTNASWPLEHADISFVFMGAAAYLASFGFRALGWRQVFPAAQRPDCARCLAACGAAAASGAVLPFRLDYLVKITTVRRLWTSRALGSALLLMALGTRFSPMLAVVVLCMAGAASILPITSGGAVVGIGATAGVLLALGVSKEIAINFSLASGLLLSAAALTAIVGITGSVAVAFAGAHGRRRLRTV